MKQISVVLDTNVFVAAAFDESTASGRIIHAVRERRFPLVWTTGTRRETEGVLRKIPPLNWEPFEDLYADELRYDGKVDLDGVSYVSDPADRKFAALAEATGATLVSNDRHLLAQRERGKTPILTSSEFWNRFGDEGHE